MPKKKKKNRVTKTKPENLVCIRINPAADIALEYLQLYYRIKTKSMLLPHIIFMHCCEVAKVPEKEHWTKYQLEAFRYCQKISKDVVAVMQEANCGKVVDKIADSEWTPPELDEIQEEVVDNLLAQYNYNRRHIITHIAKPEHIPYTGIRTRTIIKNFVVKNWPKKKSRTKKS